MNNQVFIDVSCSQKQKTSQNTCGDVFLSKRYPGERRVISVLSDGLGSGIKAHILGQMTATMLLRYVENGRDIEKAAEVVMNSLPECRVRRISYSTFTAADCHENGEVEIIEEGNPQFLWLRDGKSLEAEYETIVSSQFRERKMKRYRLILKPDDRLVFCSDGVTQAGLGSPGLSGGWKRKGLLELILSLLEREPFLSSRELAGIITAEAAKKSDDGIIRDDTSAAVIHIRTSNRLLIFTGPPYHRERDREHAEFFRNFNGKKAICGGTTANIAARELGLEISTDSPEGDLPGISHMPGTELVTEGILTLTRLLQYLEHPPAVGTQDAAVRLMNLVLANDSIMFMVGSNMNIAYYDPEWPLELELRKNIVRRIAGMLEDRYMKKTEIQFI